MKDLAPQIYRQRLIMEGFYQIHVTKERLETYLVDLAGHLELRIYGDPIIFSPSAGMVVAEIVAFTYSLGD